MIYAMKITYNNATTKCVLLLLPCFLNIFCHLQPVMRVYIGTGLSGISHFEYKSFGHAMRTELGLVGIFILSLRD